MKSKILTPQGKKRIKNFVYVIVTIIVVPLCFEFLFGIKNPRMRIDVIEEDIVFNSTPYTFFNYDTSKQNHAPIENTLFSMESYFAQASVITIKVSNVGREAIGGLNYDKNAPITLSFANSELACKPYIWSEKCVIPVNELKIIYPDTIILPSTILNHNDSYYLKVLLLTHNHNIPKIIVGGRIYNQKKIKLRIRKNVNFINENKINPLTLPEVKYLRDQNWEECTTLQPHKQ